MQHRALVVAIAVLFGCVAIVAFNSYVNRATSTTFLGENRSSLVLTDQGDSNRNRTAATTFVIATPKAPQQYGWTKVNGVSQPWYETTTLQTSSTNSTRSIRVNNTVPQTMTLIKSGKLLYCANAKVGTSTIQKVLKIDRCYSANCKQSVRRHFKNKREAIMDRAISFTHVRNPWDRIWSAYEGKIATGVIQVLQKNDMIVNFANFVHYIDRYPTENVHWMPFSYRCLTSPDAQGHVFYYDYILKLEDDGLGEGLNQVLKAANISVTIERANNVNTEHSVEARIDYYRQAAAIAGTTLEELVDSIGRTYRDDIQTFGYSFEKYN